MQLTCYICKQLYTQKKVKLHVVIRNNVFKGLQHICQECEKDYSNTPKYPIIAIIDN